MRNAKVVISILNMTLSHDKAEDENFCPLKDEEGYPATKFVTGQSHISCFGANSVSWEMALSCGNA